MPKRYAREFRRSVCERLVAGEKVSSIGAPFQLGLSYFLNPHISGGASWLT